MAGAGLLGLIVLALVVLGLVRLRRALKAAKLPPDQQVVRSWERALRALRRQGLGRRNEETPAEFAARVQTAGGHATAQTDAQATTEPGAEEAAALARLAVLVELACYAPQPCTPGDATDARALASSIVVANRRHRRRRRLRPSGSHPVRV